MYLGHNIKMFRKQKNITQDQLAGMLANVYPDTINFNKGKISKWENNKEMPYLSSAKLLADFFGITIDDLINKKFSSDDAQFDQCGNVTSYNSISKFYNQLNEKRRLKVNHFIINQLEEQKNESTKVVYIYSKLSAGTGIIDLDPYHVEEIVFDGYIPKHDMAFIVEGDSMQPTFQNGEVVFVEKNTDVHSGQFAAIQINEEAFIKKIYIEDSRLRLVSLNSEYEDIYTNKDDDIRVIGKVIL